MGKDLFAILESSELVGQAEKEPTSFDEYVKAVFGQVEQEVVGKTFICSRCNRETSEDMGVHNPNGDPICVDCGLELEARQLDNIKEE